MASAWLRTRELRATLDCLDLSAAEAGHLLGVYRATVYRWLDGSTSVPIVVELLLRLMVRPLQAERPSVAAQPLDALPDQPRPATPQPETPGAAPSVPQRRRCACRTLQAKPME